MIPNLMSAFPMQGRQQACPKARWTVLFVWCSLMCLHNPLQAAPFRGDKDSLKIGQPVTIGTPTKALPVVDNQAMYRTFPELEQYLSANPLAQPTLLQQGYAAPEFTRSYIESMFPVPAAIADSRGLAQATISEVDRKNNYTDFLSPADLVDLPVGMKKKLGNSSVTIGVSTAKFYAAYTELTVFCKIDLPQGKSIFFGANNVKLSKSGGLIGAANLVLLGDFQIPINGGNSMITLKGGMDMATGAVTNLTYAKLQCGGVKEVALAADITFPRSLLVPLKPDYSENTDTSVRVKGAFGVIVKDWNDILANGNQI